MLCQCYAYAMPMLCLCYAYAMPMLCLCYAYAMPMLCLCYAYAMPMLCLCYAMLCYAMLCYAVLCYAMLCYAMLCCAVLCYAVLCCAVLWYAVLCCAVLCCGMLWYAVLCCAVLCCGYAMLRYAMLFRDGVQLSGPEADPPGLHLGYMLLRAGELRGHCQWLHTALLIIARYTNLRALPTEPRLRTKIAASSLGCACSASANSSAVLEARISVISERNLQHGHVTSQLVYLVDLVEKPCIQARSPDCISQTERKKDQERNERWLRIKGGASLPIVRSQVELSSGPR
eukprot:g1735.t1